MSVLTDPENQAIKQRFEDLQGWSAKALEPDGDDAEMHDPHVAHHFKDMTHQFEASKLGMWLFIATEFLLFGGLFCLYAVLRSTRPEMFQYGSQFLDTRWGAINTVILITSSLTMAFAVRFAQLGQRKRLVAALALTVLGGAGFMGIKYIEYSHKFEENLVWGLAMYELPDKKETSSADVSFTPTASVSQRIADAAKGKELWTATCRSCHGVLGEGIAGQGKDIRGSEFIAGKSDADLVAFIKVGRMPFDPLNTTGIQMPGRGGNPLLKDEDLADIVAYMRTFPGAPDAQQAVVAAAVTETPVEEDFYIPRSSVPPAADPPAGLIQTAFPSDGTLEPTAHTLDPLRDPNHPANLHLFFGVYYLMTGLHGIHVLVGMFLISILAIRASFGAFGPRYFTPVDLTGLYWHVVDIIWIFLFPLLYLIH